MCLTGGPAQVMHIHVRTNILNQFFFSLAFPLTNYTSKCKEEFYQTQVFNRYMYLRPVIDAHSLIIQGWDGRGIQVGVSAAGVLSTFVNTCPLTNLPSSKGLG